MERYGAPLSLLLLDIDHFKRFNDDFGHKAGDRVIARIGEVLRRESREVDVPARYGGEEFAVLLPETDGAEATAFAERLRLALREPLYAGQERAVTVSVGLATAPADAAKPIELIERADRALYRSKASGRDRATAFAELAAPDA